MFNDVLDVNGQKVFTATLLTPAGYVTPALTIQAKVAVRLDFRSTTLNL
jgi:hypothetical protein